MASTLFMIANLAGVVDFALFGTNKARSKNLHFLQAVFCGLLTTYGGGFFFRDLILLRTMPSLFANGSEFILAAIISAVSALLTQTSIWTRMSSSSWFRGLHTVLDSLGLAAFIICGIERSIQFGASSTTTILCGLCTGIGGGIIASFFRGCSLVEVAKSGIPYRTAALAISFIYYSIRGPIGSIPYTIVLTVVVCILIEIYPMHVKRTQPADHPKSLVLTLNWFHRFYLPTPCQEIHPADRSIQLDDFFEARLRILYTRRLSGEQISLKISTLKRTLP